MGRKVTWPPPIRVRKGTAYVRITSGGRRREISLGPAGSDEARQSYARILAETAAAGGQPRLDPSGITVDEAALRYLQLWQQADPRSYHRRKRALAGVLALYATVPLRDFGPVALRTVRRQWEEQGLSRRYVNDLAGAVVLWLRWAVGEELYPAGRLEEVRELGGLERGQTAARESAPVRPVAEAIVQQTLPCLPRVPRAMVQLQLYTGARPGEVRHLRPCDLVRPWQTVAGVAVWLYRCDEHKNDWRGCWRLIPIGPRGQELLLPWLEREDTAYCFQPAENRPCRTAGPRYGRNGYAQAVRRACLAAGVESWHPSQLRHTVGTRVLTEYGKEDARCVLGHDSIRATEVYLEQVERAARVIAAIG